jgi:SAM-dependent methyltransferase
LEFDADAFTAFETAGWAEQAEAYHDFFATITTRAVDVLLDAGHVDQASRVLDIATGPGYLAAGSARRGASVVGIDIAHEMLQVARRLHPGIEFRHADAERLPFPDDSFDAVVGNFAILHRAHPERALAEFGRVLAPGGMVALSTWDAPERCRLAGVFVDAVAEVGAPPPVEVPPRPVVLPVLQRYRAHRSPGRNRVGGNEDPDGALCSLRAERGCVVARAAGQDGAHPSFGSRATGSDAAADPGGLRPYRSSVPARRWSGDPRLGAGRRSSQAAT